MVFLLAGGIGQILRKRPQRAAAALMLAGVIAALTFGSQAFAQDSAQQQPGVNNPPAQRVAPAGAQRIRPTSTSP